MAYDGGRPVVVDLVPMFHIDKWHTGQTACCGNASVIGTRVLMRCPIVETNSRSDATMLNL